ncbi:MAG: hypothetical protein K6G91_09670 [Kiritimatiellae bacterium]|nr:hypothetical protein [Kiritimatiellia bacterium]
MFRKSIEVKPTVRAAFVAGAVLCFGCLSSFADGIAVTGSAQTDGALSSLSLSFPANASPTRLFLAWGAADRGAALGNWEHVDWLADVDAGATSCDAPVSTMRPGLPFVRVFRIAPDSSAVELESASANGSQFVKTSFTPSSKAAVSCDLTLDAFANQAIFGCRSAAGANSFCLLTIVPSGSGGHGWRFDYGSQMKNSGVDPAAGQRYLAEADYRGLKINGSLLQNAAIGSQLTVQPGCVMTLFGMSTAGAVGSQSTATIHSFKAWSDTDSKATTLAADLVPCRKNGVVSFYNRVNGTFETLVTGTLAGGAEKAHGTCGAPVDSSATCNPYGTDRTMTVVRFYREHRQPTADLAFTAGLADCTLVAAHDSVDHGASIADWPAGNTSIIATVPAASTSMKTTIPWQIVGDAERYFRLFLVARNGSTSYDRQFEGIRATGTQYVLTDFTPTQTANVMVDFGFDSIQDAQAIFGARQGANNSSFAVLHTLANGYRFDYANWLDNSNVKADYNSHVINTYVAGIEVDGERILSVPADKKVNFTAPCPMAVFGLNTAGSVSAFAKGVCRYVKAWRVMSQENTRVLDLMPAMRNGEVGFYNKCDGKFYGNSGTGAFEAVNEVVNVSAQVLSDSGTLSAPRPAGMLIFVR